VMCLGLRVQGVFEGMRRHRSEGGRILLFRPSAVSSTMHAAVYSLHASVVPASFWRWGVQGVFEGMKACPQRGGAILLSALRDALRMQQSADRMSMPAPSVDDFVAAVKDTVAGQRAMGETLLSCPLPGYGEGCARVVPEV